MSLRLRLALSLAALILVLGLAAFAGVRALTDDLTRALGETAVGVGRSVVTVLRADARIVGEGEGAPLIRSESEDVRVFRHSVVPEGAAGQPPQREIRMVVNGRDLTPEEIAARMRQHHAPQVELRPGEAGKPPMLWLRSADGELPIALPRSGVDAALDRFLRQLGWGLLALLAIGLAGAFWLAQRLARPLAGLADAAEAVGRGALGARVEETGPPELRRSLAAFNHMSGELARLDREAAALRADRELAELGEIGRGLAHSLRNPLHALGLGLEALAAGGADRDAVEALHRNGREQLARIDQALRGFLALSAGAGAQPEPVALRALVDDVALEAAQRAQGRVDLAIDGVDRVLRGVPAELRILLHTLVINALEASPDGATVAIRLGEAADGAACIEVEDAGPGLAPEIRARLFAPHISSKPAGAGMGLYLAERLVRLRYRGAITLADRDGGGTRATLLLHDREVRDERA